MDYVKELSIRFDTVNQLIQLEILKGQGRVTEVLWISFFHTYANVRKHIRKNTLGQLFHMVSMIN